MNLTFLAVNGYCTAFHVTFALLIMVSIAALCIYLQFRRQVKKQLRSELQDSLTGMGNAIYFSKQFHTVITDENRHLYYIAYLAFDIARTNKFFGQVVSKQLIRYTSSILKHYVQPADVVARLTEDGFGIAFQASSVQVAQEGVERLLEVLGIYGKNLGSEHRIPFHAGIYHLKETDRSCEESLFKARQGFTYASEHHLSVSFSNEKILQQMKETTERQQNIISALKNHEFKVYLQFIVSKDTKMIRGAEALSRWQHPQWGLLSPGQYIDIMEELGSISELDFYIFRETCRQLESWKKQKYRDIKVTCNFTRITISAPDFVDRIRSIASEFDFDHSNLVMEITEDVAESDTATAIRNIADCKAEGFQIALDDMGDGYSSFLNLCEYPLDYVKIDRQIILKSDTPKGRALLNGMVALAHSMNIEVVCEGVETPQQNKAVCSSQCDYIQGFYYSKPMPQESAEDFIEKYASRRA